MNCPKCGNQLTEREEMFLCGTCGAMFRRRKTSTVDSKEKPSVESTQAKLPEESVTPAPQSEEPRRIADLDRRLAETESRQRAEKEKDAEPVGEKAKRSFGTTSSFVKAHKKIIIFVAVAVVLVLSVMIPLLVTFCGVRGVYVNVNNPKEYLRFGVSSVVYCEDVTDPDSRVEGKYKIADKEIIFTMKHEQFGEVSDIFAFRRMNGDKTIKIGDDLYVYIAYSVKGDVKVTFDLNGGNGTTQQIIERGKKIETLPVPTKMGYLFIGWKVSPKGYYDADIPVWGNMRLVAEWEECDHSGMSCNETICQKCGKLKNSMKKIETQGLLHSFNGGCVCTKCDVMKHNYSTEHVCTRCGIEQVRYSGTTLIKVQPDSLGEFTVSNEVAKIGSSAFFDCWGLTSITIPNTVTDIGASAFEDCSGLTTVTIPNSVTNIGSYAFYKCSSLTLITYQGTKKEWNAIPKYYHWDASTGDYTIHCTDGTIPKS